MKRSTIILLGEISALYFAVLIIARGFIPESVTIPIYFLVLPIALVILILAIDLSGQVTKPSETRQKVPPPRKLGRGIERLAKQVQVGTSASSEYYETVLLARLRDIFLEKVSLETGMDKERTREILKNRFLGPGLIRNDELYRFLYSGVSKARTSRIADLDRVVKLIEAWRP